VESGIARRRLGEASVGRLATVGAGGRPHVVPCCFVLRGDVVYTAVDAKPKSGRTLRRIENLEANAAFALIVDHYEDDWSRLWWVRVDGSGRIVSDDDEEAEAVRLLTGKYPQYRDVAILGPVLALDIRSWTSWP